MTNKKISALTGATTPLGGTELVPITQSGVTVNVSVANLTVGRAVGTAGGTFTDNQIQGTAAKGINFTANTPAAGMTSQLLNWYEEGTWTPTVTAPIGTITSYVSTGKYTRVGKQVTLLGEITLTNSGTGAGYLIISTFPFNLVDSLVSGAGREIALTGEACSISYNSSSSVSLNLYNNANACFTGRKYSFVIAYIV